ncbi:hypothetical protein N9937_01015 [bacterium]|nr:hypothetical protein [bacterium]
MAYYDYNNDEYSYYNWNDYYLAKANGTGGAVLIKRESVPIVEEEKIKLTIFGKMLYPFVMVLKYLWDAVAFLFMNSGRAFRLAFTLYATLPIILVGYCIYRVFVIEPRLDLFKGMAEAVEFSLSDINDHRDSFGMVLYTFLAMLFCIGVPIDMLYSCS